ncbi:unnamed protein product [Ceutorhynchus assimilis]|uniref:Baculoviridae p74 N-terminal domain-containing protein n=1 Tax=Ceutorhynchus assimilis TaxID=467358 RepID=A0A9N9MX21_9CUCU|nr:unnamed protein product [Ceutorhynchus assimilis]
MDDKTLQTFMMGIAEDAQLTTIPAVTNVGTVKVFPYSSISGEIDWDVVLYSFSLEPGNSIIYEHGRWRAQSFTYDFEGTQLYRTDTLTHERQLFMEFNLDMNLELVDNGIVSKPYCKQKGNVPIRQDEFAHFYKTTETGGGLSNIYQYGYWVCLEQGANPTLVLCQNKKFDLQLVACREYSECEMKSDNYIWPDVKNSTKYYQCQNGVVVHASCPEASPVFNGLRCINPTCFNKTFQSVGGGSQKFVLADNFRVPNDDHSYFLCRDQLEGTKITCRLGVDASRINCLYKCTGSTAFVVEYLETLQVTPKTVPVGQTACVDGNIVKVTCSTILTRKLVHEDGTGKTLYYWTPDKYLEKGSCKEYDIIPPKGEMLQFLRADPAISSNITGNGDALPRLIPYDSFASFESDRTHYYNTDGVKYDGVLFYFGTQRFIIDAKYLNVPSDTASILNNNHNGVWTEQLIIEKISPGWIENASNDCDAGIEFLGLYYVNKSGTGMCLDGKPSIDICDEHDLKVFVNGCGCHPMEKNDTNEIVPQNADYLDMSTYATQRQKLFMAEKMANKYPEIFSWCDIVIRPAISPQDYVYEKKFADWAIWVDWTWTKTGCTKISCNPSGQKFDCTVKDAPFAFRSGDTTWTACEPACFFRNDIPSTSTGVHSLQTQYHNGKCYWVSSAIHAWMTNPTGSTYRLVADTYNIPTIKGRINKYYCDAYFQELKGDDCEEPWWSEVLGYTFLGQSLIKFIDQAASPNAGTRDQVSLEPDLKSLPAYMLDKHVWKRHINDSFKMIKPDVLLSDLGFTPAMLSQEKRGHFLFHNSSGIVERFLFYDSVEYTTNRSSSRTEYLRLLEPIGEIAKTNHRRRRSVRETRATKQNLSSFFDWDSIGDRFSRIASVIMQMLVQKDFYVQVGVDYSWHLLSQKLGPEFKEILSKVFSNMSQVLASNSARIIDTIASHEMGHIASYLIVKSTTKFTLMLTRMAAVSSTVIGVVADIALFLDLAVMLGWDPLGLKNQIDSQILEILREQAIVTRYKTGDPNCEIDPSFFSKFVLNENFNDNTTTTPMPEPKSQFSYAHSRYKSSTTSGSDTIARRTDSGSIKRPRLYHTQTLFQISCLSEYLNARTSNSIGQRYDWDRDIVRNTDEWMTRYEIFSHLMQKTDLTNYTETLQARQCLTVIILFILITVIALTIFFAKPLVLLVAPLIWLCAYVRFGNNEIHNSIIENLYRAIKAKNIT